MTPREPGGRDAVLLLVMVSAAASADAISYLGLGRVFPANMTGNTVLLGIGLVTGDLTHAAHSAAALGGFVLGAAIAGARPYGARRWTRGPGLDAYCETALVVAALVWWRVGAPSQLPLVGMLSLAMGLQSAAIGRLGLGLSATYITGTWTAASTWFGRLALRATGRRAGPDPGPTARSALQAGVVASYLAVACLAAFLFSHWQAWALLIPAAALAAAGSAASARVGERPERVDAQRNAG